MSRPPDRKLALSMVAQGTRTMVALAGRIDETSGLSSVGSIATREVTIDLGGVTFINSLGVREWVRALRSLAQRRTDVTLSRVPAVLVPHFNMVPEMSAGTRVVSFEAPYSCAKCGREGPMLLDVAVHGAALRASQAPALPCPECRSPMDLDELPQQYFLFLELDHAAASTA